MFVAVIRGTAVDGHAYIDDCHNKVIAVTDRLQKSHPFGRRKFLREKKLFHPGEDSADALGKLVSAWYDSPSDKLTLVGVTAGRMGRSNHRNLIVNVP